MIGNIQPYAWPTNVKRGIILTAVLLVVMSYVGLCAGLASLVSLLL
jgi:hypothetical protein